MFANPLSQHHSSPIDCSQQRNIICCSLLDEQSISNIESFQTLISVGCPAHSKSSLDKHQLVCQSAAQDSLVCAERCCGTILPRCQCSSPATFVSCQRPTAQVISLRRTAHSRSDRYLVLHSHKTLL